MPRKEASMTHWKKAVFYQTKNIQDKSIENISILIAQQITHQLGQSMGKLPKKIASQFGTLNDQRSQNSHGHNS